MPVSFPKNDFGQKSVCKQYSKRYVPGRFSLVNGGIAQLVERLVRNEKARGSNPLTSSPERLRGCRAVVPRLRDEGGHVLPCNVNAASYDSASRRDSNVLLRLRP